MAATLPALYVLASDYNAAAERLADLDLPPEVVADTLEGLAGDLEAKATNVAMMVRNLESTAEQIKAAEAAMAARRRAIENRAEHVRGYLLANMQRVGISKIECPYFKLSVRDNPPAVEVYASADIPDEFMRRPEPPPAAPDKKAIADALKAGRTVPGACLKRSQRLEIR